MQKLAALVGISMDRLSTSAELPTLRADGGIDIELFIADDGPEYTRSQEAAIRLADRGAGELSYELLIPVTSVQLAGEAPMQVTGEGLTYGPTAYALPALLVLVCVGVFAGRASRRFITSWRRFAPTDVAGVSVNQLGLSEVPARKVGRGGGASIERTSLLKAGDSLPPSPPEDAAPASGPATAPPGPAPAAHTEQCDVHVV